MTCRVLLNILVSKIFTLIQKSHLWQTTKRKCNRCFKPAFHKIINKNRAKNKSSFCFVRIHCLCTFLIVLQPKMDVHCQCRKKNNFVLHESNENIIIMIHCFLFFLLLLQSIKSEWCTACTRDAFYMIALTALSNGRNKNNIWNTADRK